MNSTPAAKPAPAYAIPGSEAKNTNPGAQSQVSYNFLFDNHLPWSSLWVIVYFLGRCAVV